jgi:polysaccharide export outer membrane protein
MDPFWHGRSAQIATALFLCALANTAAQTSTPVAVSAPATSPPFQERYPRYELRSGDSFDLGFEFSPEFNQSVTVQPDGFISLREIGDVHISGLTLPQLRQLLEARYGSILTKPKISITPKDLEKSYFIALGEVARPGKYELRGEIPVTQALALAGGVTADRAKHSDVVLFRRQGDAFGTGTVVNMKKMLNNKDLHEDLYVKPGDLIYVPQNAWSKVRPLIPTPGIGMQLMPGTLP